MLDLRTSYLLSLVSVFGVAGLHRFYLGRYKTGVLWVLTWGLFGFGTLYDLITMRRLVERANFERGLLPGQDGLPPHEAAIRAVAQQQGGGVTPESVATVLGWKVSKARAELDRLALNNACAMVLQPGGSVVYRFETDEDVRG